jgi:hypothetical protein
LCCLTEGGTEVEGVAECGVVLGEKLGVETEKVTRD